MTGRALVVQGNALALPLPDASVDLVVTSPPYHGLRDYGTGHPAELGSEATPTEFLAALWAATAEMKRVLKPSGSVFVNLGDSYCSAERGPDGSSSGLTNGPQQRPGHGRQVSRMGVPRKSLLGLPWAYALGCTGQLAQLGGPNPGLNLILRAEVVWHKTNGLPESGANRVRRSHETWFHMTKSPRYYAALDELREPYSTEASDRRAKYGQHPGRDGLAGLRATGVAKHGSNGVSVMGVGGGQEHALGKLPGSVWQIPSEPLDLPDYLVRLPTGVTMMDAGPLWRHTEWMRRTGQPGPVLVRELDHSAAFPSEWPRRLVLGWSPPGICLECGQGRFPVVDKRQDTQGRTTNGPKSLERRFESPGREVRTVAEATILGYACACTPHTDHPERRRPSTTPAGKVLTQDGDLREALGLRRTHIDGWPERQPVREYHLAGWTPPPTRPAVVLDPFGGAGTTAAVGRALGRTVVTLDLSHDYSLAAQWRVRHAPTIAKTVRRTNADAQSRAVDPGVPVPVAPKPPTFTYADAAAEQANRERQGALL